MTQVSPLNHQRQISPKFLDAPRYGVSVECGTAGQELEVADPKAVRALTLLMNQEAIMGGAACHWGGPSAFAEMNSALYSLTLNTSRQENTPWPERYNIVNDAGHAENGLYALRAIWGQGGAELGGLKGFRSVSSPLTGHGEAHMNPDQILVSNGPLGSAMAQAQGLAMGDKLNQTKRTTFCLLSDGGAMEGEAKEALASIPGLAKKGKLSPFVLLVSDNNTKLSGRIDQDAFSMNPTFESLEALGWAVQRVEDGHNLKEVIKAIDTATRNAEKDSEQPQAIWFKTIKGKGLQKTEEASSGGHGHPFKAYSDEFIDALKEVYSPSSPPTEFMDWAHEISKRPKPESSSISSAPKDKVQAGISKALIQAREQGHPVCSVSSDLAGSTGVAPFIKKFPEASFDIGVAESNMMSAAIGLSLSGLIPIVDTFAQFAITKGNLPLIMSQLSQGPFIGIFTHTGFQDAADGASHQSTTYLAAVNAIPNVETIVCSTAKEAEVYIQEAIARFSEDRKKGLTPKTTLFFAGREKFALEHAGVKYSWNEHQVLKEGKDLLLVAHGPMTHSALEVSKLLEGEGLNAGVVNWPFTSSSPNSAFKKMLSEHNKTLVTIEDHQASGGLGLSLNHQLLIQGEAPRQSLSFGIDGKFGQSAYTAAELYDLHGLSPRKIVRKILDEMKK